MSTPTLQSRLGLHRQDSMVKPQVRVLEQFVRTASSGTATACPSLSRYKDGTGKASAEYRGSHADFREDRQAISWLVSSAVLLHNCSVHVDERCAC
jgi:hypothetical protein